MHSRSKCLAVALVAGAIGAGSWTGTSEAGTSVPRLKLGPARYSYRDPNSANARASAPAGRALTTVTEFVQTINDHGTNFTVRIVGKNPHVHQTNPVTNVKTELIPVIFKIAGQTFNPTVGDSCDTTSAFTRTKNSPIFVKQTYSSGGLPLGTGQYVDIVQRAQFYSRTKPGALNPNYHVNLLLATPATVTVTVPSQFSGLGTTNCGNHKMGGVEIGYFINLIQSSIIPQLHQFGVGPTTFPLFLIYNTVLFQGNVNNCCILGFHNSFISGNTQQTYGVSIYDNTHNFSGSSDVSAMSHEVSEWMNDPGVGQNSTINKTKPWGNIGQVSGCQGNFETGDPLSGHTLTDNLNGKTYHVQELAYEAWFYHQSPSPSLHGTYSFQGSGNGRFAGFAKPCPPGGTN